MDPGGQAPGPGRGGCQTSLTLGYLKEGNLQTVLGSLPGLLHLGLHPLPVQNWPQKYLEESLSLGVCV